jgi:hypothetical protein
MESGVNIEGGVTQRELELFEKLFGAKLETLNTRMDSIESWLKIGAGGFVALAVGVIGTWIKPGAAHSAAHVIAQLVTVHAG